MVARLCVECPGCKQAITIRFSVGVAAVQPFYFVCASCGAATRGRVVLDDVQGGGLELEAGRQLPSQQTKQAITVNTELPNILSASEMWHDGGSPFLMWHMRLGDRLDELMRRAGRFREAVEADGPAVWRLAGYYIDRNDHHFDSTLAEIMPQWPSPSRPWHRHDGMHKILDLLVAPLWAQDVYPRMKASWNTLLDPKGSNGQAVVAACDICASDSGFVDAQRSVLDCLRLFVDLREALLPALPVELLDDPDNKSADLRLMRDDFPQLRDLYIQSFEACHHALNYMIGPFNAAMRGSPTAFRPPRGKEKVPNSIKAYGKMRAVQKPEWFDELGPWYSGWMQTLDRPLRNAIGHRSVRHDLRSGALELVDGTQIPYLSFVRKSMALVHPLLVAAHALKLNAVLSELKLP